LNYRLQTVGTAKKAITRKGDIGERTINCLIQTTFGGNNVTTEG